MMILALSLLAAAPAPVKALPTISAPLGRIGAVVEDLPQGGVPGQHKVLMGKLDGCEKEQAFYLTRLLAGSLTAVEQLQNWLNLTPGLEKKLFPAGKLGEVSQHVAVSAFTEQRLCGTPPLKDEFKLETTAAPKKLCASSSADRFRVGDFWWLNDRLPAALISLTPAKKDAPDRCRPRFSVVFFDKKGVARFRLHADWGGAASANLLGDKCGLDFNFEPSTQSFIPVWRSAKGCGK